MSEEITSRINRNELLDLLHATAIEKEMDPQTDTGDGWDDWEEPQPVTARMPAVTLDRLLVPDELPAPPFVIRFRSAAGTDQVRPLVFGVPVVDIPPTTDVQFAEGTITDDIEPEVSTALGRATSQAFDATITAAIDAAVDELVQTPVDAALTAAMEAEDRRTTAVIPRVAPPVERLRMLPMFCGFALTFIAGIALMFLIS